MGDKFKLIVMIPVKRVILLGVTLAAICQSACSSKPAAKGDGEAIEQSPSNPGVVEKITDGGGTIYVEMPFANTGYTLSAPYTISPALSKGLKPGDKILFSAFKTDENRPGTITNIIKDDGSPAGTRPP